MGYLFNISRVSMLAAEIERLDGLSRTRALSLSESVALERAIKEQARIAGRTRIGWSRQEDSEALRLRLAGYSYGRIARHFAYRSKDAVAARLRYIGGEARP